MKVGREREEGSIFRTNRLETREDSLSEDCKTKKGSFVRQKREIVKFYYNTIHTNNWITH